ALAAAGSTLAAVALEVARRIRTAAQAAATAVALDVAGAALGAGGRTAALRTFERARRPARAGLTRDELAPGAVRIPWLRDDRGPRRSAPVDNAGGDQCER